MRIGAVPPLAAAFQNRTRVREAIDAARAGAGGVVLTQVLAGGGGYGKSQLAAAYANDAVNSGTELVVWVHAAEEQALITTYARAATAVHAPGASGDDPVADAEQFMAWLATTSRSWLVVLDNITDPTAVQKWWPQGRAGWVLATTRLHTDARLTAAGRTLIPIDVYTPQEAHTYLKDRLTAAGRAHLHHHEAAGQIIEQLGRLPLALGFAAAYMIEEDATCGEYLDHLTNGQLSDALPAWADAEDYGQPVTAALLLNLNAATASGPPGLVEPALRLAALLDPDGHPLGLWDTPPVLAYLTAAHHTAWWKRRGRKKITAPQAHAALAALHRYGLLTRDRTNGPRAVRIHALTARTVRETTPAHQEPALATTAADALLDLWPDPDQPHRDLAATLRSNTDTLHTHTQPHLWNREGHPVLYRAGISLLDAGLTTPAIEYWTQLQQTAHNHLGPHHPATLTARNNLAHSYAGAGRITEAIALEEQVLADSERVLGAHHPGTLTTRGNLATSYRQAGRITEAIALQEQVLADRERVLGTEHPNTLTTRGNLATSYRQAGRTEQAIALQEQVLADSERILGTEHPNTLLARGNLATSYRQAGRTTEAIALQEQVLADRERILGTEHPDTLLARNNLATSYWQAGRTEEAIALVEQVLADSERVLGTEHPDTLTARGNLAHSYWQARRTEEAIALEEQVLADRERALGTEHPDTLTARGNLAHSYQQARRTTEAIALLEQVLADRERVLGAEHPDTEATRAVLARWLGGEGDVRVVETG